MCAAEGHEICGYEGKVSYTTPNSYSIGNVSYTDKSFNTMYE